MEKDFRDGHGPICTHLNTIGAALKGLEAYPIHLKKQQANRAIVIDGIHDASAISCVFTREEEGKEPISLNIAEYFKQTYCYTLKFPHLPVIASKRRGHLNFFPMELLEIVPGQRIKLSKMTPDIQQHMTGRNASLPKQHAAESRRVLEEYLKANGGNPHFKAFRLRLKSTTPITMQAKILAPPYIKFKDDRVMQIFGDRVAFQQPGTFVKPAKIRNVMVINFDRNFHDVDKFMRGLHEQCGRQGLQMRKPPNEWDVKTTGPESFDDLRRYMEKAKEKDHTIVIGIVEEKKPIMHDYMKYFEETIGMQTLQITTDTARKFGQMGGGKQTIDNVIRKLNPKCGGTNFYVQLPEKHKNGVACRDPPELYKKLYSRTQFIGFELSHTGSRTRFDIQKNNFEGDPTSVGVSYSLRHAAQLGGFTYFQDTRLHKLTKLDTKFATCLEGYYTAEERLPDQLVIYRIGSGEGDYEHIREEVNEMRKACAAYKDGYAPKFVVILVQRRSRIRIFPERIEGFKSIEQNVPSGTCVDTVGNAHGYDEFVLCCQTPLIGTVRPTRYTVLVNDSGWTKNEVMNVTYQLSFAHQVSYQPPAVPNVLYAAENLAKRGHNNYKTHSRLKDMRDYTQRIADEFSDDVTQEQVADIMSARYIEMISEEINAMTISGRNFWA